MLDLGAKATRYATLALCVLTDVLFDDVLAMLLLLLMLPDVLLTARCVLLDVLLGGANVRLSGWQY